MGNLVLIEIFLNGDVRNGSYRSNVGQDFVVLHKLPRLFKRLWRAVGIVERNQVHLPVVDATLLVQHLKVARHDAAVARKCGSRTAIGNGLADLDFSVRYAWTIFFFGGFS